MIKYDIPGWINNKQCDLITNLISTLPPNAKILEIGTALGRSSYSILDGMKESQSLDVCDLWDDSHWANLVDDHDYAKSTLFGDKNLIDSAVENIRSVGIQKTWEGHVANHYNSKLIRNVFRQHSTSLTDTDYDLIYLDGDHSYENVYKELNKFKHVPIICGDDFSYHLGEDVIKAVIDFGKENNRVLESNLTALFFVLRF